MVSDSGRHNNAFGHRALYSKIHGSFNVSLGSLALYNNTGGAANQGQAYFFNK
jgi:hypothetical protein